MIVRQCELSDGDTTMTAWLEDRLKVGNMVTLKNHSPVGRLWTVIAIHDPAMDLQEIDRTWNV